MIYVGTIEWPYRHMIMFHMASDSQDPEELHQMADKLGIRRKWFQNKGTDSLTPHYDICKSKKVAALKLGATEMYDGDIIKRCFPEFHKKFGERGAK